MNRPQTLLQNRREHSISTMRVPSCQEIVNPQSRPMKTQHQIEEELIQLLQQRHVELISATEHTRETAHASFQQALHAFTAFIIDGKMPDEE